MISMKVSLIIAVYKDIEALDLIIQALRKQTYKDFEVIVAEDGDSPEMKSYLSTLYDLRVKHTFQEDLGIRKTRSLNNGILASDGEYLIFIDGDCVPYSTFIEGHVALAEEGYILSGRRINLGPKYSKALREHQLAPYSLEKTFVWRFPFIAKDSEEGHTENGFYFTPSGLFYRSVIGKRKASTSLLGCNYSCYRKDMVAINGYDEAYGETAVGDDTDLEWRFKGIGLKIKPVKFVANLFHLYHSRKFREAIYYQDALELLQINREQNRFRCQMGLDTH